MLDVRKMKQSQKNISLRMDTSNNIEIGLQESATGTPLKSSNSSGALAGLTRKLFNYVSGSPMSEKMRGEYDFNQDLEGNPGSPSFKKYESPKASLTNSQQYSASPFSSPIDYRQNSALLGLSALGVDSPVCFRIYLQI
jgi:hypothetical protein